MKRTLLLLLWLPCSFFLFAQSQQTVLTPDQVYGDLFREVQMQRVFADGKTFVDCTPKRNPKEIVADYIQQKPSAGFDLKKFVETNFDLPASPQSNYTTQEKEVVPHIKNLWTVLRREADKPVEGSSLLPLPYPYIVPGGRFREIYYWDSYFTMLGLKESGETEMIENMIRNFAYLIQTYGHIPNGNRSYYLSRSQPPFFALMVELLAGIKGDSVYAVYLPALAQEHAFWMEGTGKLKEGGAYRRVVKLKNGAILNRYWDDVAVPRQESYREDVETAEQAVKLYLAKHPSSPASTLNALRIHMYQQLKAGAESGIDFSSRWFRDKNNLATIQITDMIPVDLNALLYKQEMVIAKAKIVAKDEKGAIAFRKLAEARRLAIDKYCWNKTLKYYTDYNFKTDRVSQIVAPAGLYPFCVFESNLDYLSLLARNAAEQVRGKLLAAGGVLATENSTGQQWDAPNGWAPLEWMTIWGLDRCGQRELARDIAQRWIKLNIDVFKRTGKMMEKYNIANTTLEAGGGEYPGQDGFGWSNGVLLKLISLYGLPKE